MVDATRRRIAAVPSLAGAGDIPAKNAHSITQVTQRKNTVWLPALTGCFNLFLFLSCLKMTLRCFVEFEKRGSKLWTH